MRIDPRARIHPKPKIRNPNPNTYLVGVALAALGVADGRRQETARFVLLRCQGRGIGRWGGGAFRENTKSDRWVLFSLCFYEVLLFITGQSKQNVARTSSAMAMKV